MKESYGKGLANHPGPACPPKPWRRRELCGGGREAAAEALAGAHAGRVSSSEINDSACRPCSDKRIRGSDLD